MHTDIFDGVKKSHFPQIYVIFLEIIYVICLYFDNLHRFPRIFFNYNLLITWYHHKFIIILSYLLFLNKFNKYSYLIFIHYLLKFYNSSIKYFIILFIKIWRSIYYRHILFFLKNHVF